MAKQLSRAAVKTNGSTGVSFRLVVKGRLRRNFEAVEQIRAELSDKKTYTVPHAGFDL